MHHADIIAELTKAGYPAAKVAGDLGFSRGYVSLVIHGDRKSLKIANKVAAVINKDVDIIWPGIYNIDARKVA